jgi:hypothetical protein
MMTFSTKSSADILEIQNAFRDSLPVSSAFEVAAQRFSTLLFSRFSPSVALARVFATIRYRALPETARAFVDELATSKNVTVIPDTPVLTLLGSAGSLPEWNDRRSSNGHIALPLASAAFVRSIPMIARLMQEMGGDPRLFDGRATALSSKASTLGGLFYVEDAATAKDSEGRLVIPSVEFVTSQRIKTVFALGTSYADGTFVTAIVFTRERVEKRHAQMLLPMLNLMKAVTTPVVHAGRFFT